MPLKSVLICHQDAPWMTISFKTLIKKRQKALAEGKENLFKIYRNKVNKEHKLIRRSFYREKVQSTESRDPNKRVETSEKIMWHAGAHPGLT